VPSGSGYHPSSRHLDAPVRLIHADANSDGRHHAPEDVSSTHRHAAILYRDATGRFGFVARRDRARFFGLLVAMLLTAARIVSSFDRVQRAYRAHTRTWSVTTRGANSSAAAVVLLLDGARRHDVLPGRDPRRFRFIAQHEINPFDTLHE